MMDFSYRMEDALFVLYPSVKNAKLPSDVKNARLILQNMKRMELKCVWKIAKNIFLDAKSVLITLCVKHALLDIKI